MNFFIRHGQNIIKGKEAANVPGSSGSVENKEYQQKVEKVKPRPAIVKNLIWAFMTGGLICAFGQVIQFLYIDMGLGSKEATAVTSATMIFFGAFFTGLGVYDELGKRAGAGSIVPITGFANSIVAPAMEFKREGYVFGVGAKMFVIAGPVIVYGTLTAVVVGFAYWMLH